MNSWVCWKMLIVHPTIHLHPGVSRLHGLSLNRCFADPVRYPCWDHSRSAHIENLTTKQMAAAIHHDLRPKCLGHDSLLQCEIPIMMHHPCLNENRLLSMVQKGVGFKFRISHWYWWHQGCIEKRRLWSSGKFTWWPIHPYSLWISDDQSWSGGDSFLVPGEYHGHCEFCSV